MESQFSNADKSSKGRMPLDGIRVIDLTRAMAGPFCTMMLADMGADVIKVEPPSGDETRLWGPPFVSGESTYFLSINRNKKSIVIDLRNQKGIEILKRLVKNSHVLVENYRPGTTEKLGISYDMIRQTHPSIVYCSISGFGQNGPMREKPGYDLIALAASGMMSITGEAGRPPVKMGVPVSDICAGMYGAYAIVASLYKKEKDKQGRDHETRAIRGQHIDVSMMDGQISWLTHQASAYFATGKNPEPLGSMHPSIAPYQAFKGSDGQYFVIAVGNDELWSRLCRVLNLTSLKDDIRFRSNSERVKNRDTLVMELTNLFASSRAKDWVQKITSAGVPCNLINKLGDVFENPQVASRDMVVECEHPTAGRIRQLGIPYHFNDFEFTIRLPPPLIGQNTTEILSELGYSMREIEELRVAKTIA